MSRKSTRRDFLRGKSAADAVSDMAEKVVSDMDPVEGPVAGGYLVHVARPAMAGQFELFFNAGQYEADLEAALEALDLIEALEAQLTYFRDTSEISRINRLAAEEPVEVEPRLFALLEQSLRLSEETGGAFDITASPLWEVWGFSRRAGRIPGETELADAMEKVGSQFVELDPATRTIRFRKPGVKLNLGSIGKGYALDRAAEILAEKGIGDYLFHGGQSSVLARGALIEAKQIRGEGGDVPAGWTVGVRHPLRRGTRLAEIRLRDQSLGTSGSGVQFFRYQGRRYGHVLDPRTGRPAEALLSATVIAPDAALSDALATAMFVMGVEASLEYCRLHPEIGVVLVSPPIQGGDVEIRTAGLGEDQLRLLEPL